MPDSCSITINQSTHQSSESDCGGSCWLPECRNHCGGGVDDSNGAVRAPAGTFLPWLLTKVTWFSLQSLEGLDVRRNFGPCKCVKVSHEHSFKYLSVVVSILKLLRPTVRAHFHRCSTNHSDLSDCSGSPVSPTSGIFLLCSQGKAT